MEDQKLYIDKISNKTVKKCTSGANIKNTGGSTGRLHFRRAIIAAVSVWVMATILIMPACITVNKTTESEGGRVSSIDLSDIIPGLNTPGVVIQYPAAWMNEHNTKAPQTKQAVVNGIVYEGEYAYSRRAVGQDRGIDYYLCEGDIIAISANEGELRMFEKCYLGFERETGKFRSISFSVPRVSSDSEYTLTQDDALKMATSIAAQYVEIDSCKVDISDHLFVFTDYGGYNDFSAFAFAFTNQDTNNRIEIRITKEGYLSTVEISGD